MIFFAPKQDNTEEENESTNEIDTETSIDDAMLDEITEPESADDTTETEGFGHLDDTEATEEVKEEKSDDEDSESLEDDAEDVDFDTFDDIDEL